MEVTEYVFADLIKANKDDAEELLHRLGECGVGLSLDDDHIHRFTEEIDTENHRIHLAFGALLVEIATRTKKINELEAEMEELKK